MVMTRRDSAAVSARTRCEVVAKPKRESCRDAGDRCRPNKTSIPLFKGQKTVEM